MADLVAQGPRPEYRWRRQLEPDLEMELGRTTQRCSVPWDRHISRLHIRMRLDGDYLNVEKAPGAANPILFGGTQLEKFRMKSGDHFVIGQTTFTFSNERASATLEVPEPAGVRAFSAEDIDNVRFSDSDRRLAVLTHLPEIISSASNESDLLVRLTNVLLSGIRHASTIAIVSLNNSDQIDVLHWDRRIFAGEDFRPSERLIKRALENRETILHYWDRAISQISNLTIHNENQWAFVSPLGGQACRHQAIYVLGNETDPGGFGDRVSSEMQSDIKFAELVGKLVASLRDVQLLERNQSALRSFFSPIVMDAFAGQSLEEALTPKKSDISVLFCDLRGFSRTSEQLSDSLLELLDRVSQALGVTTRAVLDEGGVIGDFHGDAVMGFWGWPLEQSDNVTRACRAAIQIEEEFVRVAAEETHALSDFRIGIGLATGPAVAGKIGTSDQVKVTAFGPTVNVASRLEGLTKMLKVPILVDDATALKINADAQSDLCAVRLARCRPAGMERTVEVAQLLSTEAAQQFDVVLYEHALLHFMHGEWDESRQKLLELSVETGPARFLLDYMNQLGHPPVDFDGVISLATK